MKTSKHTKGPWSIEVIEGEQIYIFSQEGSQGECVAVVADREMEFDGSRNAHLIAAAPEMLEALCSIYYMANLEQLLKTKYSSVTVSMIMQQMESAISKARGES